MLQLLFITVLLGVTTADNLPNFRGKWLVPLTYTVEPTTLEPGKDYCQWYNITSLDPMRCSCDDRGDIPVYHNGLYAFPVIYIEHSDAVEPLFDANCFCNGVSSQHLILKTINLKSYVVYYKPKFMGVNAPLYVSLLLKDVPKLSELYAMWKSVAELKDKTPTLLCNKRSFLPE